MVYVHPWHKRETETKLEIAKNFFRYDHNKDHMLRDYVLTTQVSPRHVFPKERFDTEDFDLDPGNMDPDICLLPEYAKLIGEIDIPPSFFAANKEDMRTYAMQLIYENKKYLPLRQDDFFNPQYS